MEHSTWSRVLLVLWGQQWEGFGSSGPTQAKSHDSTWLLATVWECYIRWVIGPILHWFSYVLISRIPSWHFFRTALLNRQQRGKTFIAQWKTKFVSTLQLYWKETRLNWMTCLWVPIRIQIAGWAEKAFYTLQEENGESQKGFIRSFSPIKIYNSICF